MKYFCDNCHNLLYVNTSNNILTFNCMMCYSVYSSENDDSLRYEETQSGNLVIFKTILNNARKDPVNLKAHVTCPKCKYHTAKRVRLGAEMRLINICEDDKCGFQWLEMY